MNEDDSDDDDDDDDDWNQRMLMSQMNRGTKFTAEEAKLLMGGGEPESGSPATVPVHALVPASMSNPDRVPRMSRVSAARKPQLADVAGSAQSTSAAQPPRLAQVPVPLPLRDAFLPRDAAALRDSAELLQQSPSLRGAAPPLRDAPPPPPRVAPSASFGPQQAASLRADGNPALQQAANAVAGLVLRQQQERATAAARAKGGAAAAADSRGSRAPDAGARRGDALLRTSALQAQAAPYPGPLTESAAGDGDGDGGLAKPPRLQLVPRLSATVAVHSSGAAGMDKESRAVPAGEAPAAGAARGGRSTKHGSSRTLDKTGAARYNFLAPLILWGVTTAVGFGTSYILLSTTAAAIANIQACAHAWSQVWPKP